MDCAYKVAIGIYPVERGDGLFENKEQTKTHVQYFSRREVVYFIYMSSLHAIEAHNLVGMDHFCCLTGSRFKFGLLICSGRL
jgi:hypothetical protein